jgi:FkbM family methyltransferase
MREALKTALKAFPGGSRLLSEIQIAHKYKTMRLQIAERVSPIPMARGSVVIDLGAHIGLFSEHCLARGAVVHAYEPDPITFRKLVRLESRYAAFHPHNSAVGARSEMAPLFHHRDSTINQALTADSSSLISEKNNVGKRSTLVKVEAIDDVLGAHEHIALLKIDIEGAEYDIYESVIRGIDRIDRVLMETHVGAIPTRKREHDAMLAEIERRGLTMKFMLNWF